MAKKVLMSKEEAKGLNAKESFEFVKKMLQTKKQKLTLKDFEPGKLLMYKYNAKNKEETFDATPLVLVLKYSRRYVLGINFHWAPIPLRIILVKKILNMNKRNIKEGKALDFSYKDLKPFLKRIGFAPIIRVYLKNRISELGVIIPPEHLMDAARTKSETFTNGKVSAEELYKRAIAGNKKYRSTRKRRE